MPVVLEITDDFTGLEITDERDTAAQTQVFGRNGEIVVGHSLASAEIKLCGKNCLQGIMDLCCCLH